MGTTDSNAGALETARERAARHGAMLRELAEIGLAISRGLRELMIVDVARARQAQAAWTPPGAGPAPAPKVGRDVSIAYSRVAKAVRQTLLLEQRLLNPDGPDAGPAPWMVGAAAAKTSSAAGEH